MLNTEPQTAMRVLIAIEPRAYSQTIGYTVRALRPRYVVQTVDPDTIRREVERRAPDLVLCSLPRPITSGEGTTWVTFLPYAPAGEQISVNERQLGLESVDFADLLFVLDEAATLR